MLNIDICTELNTINVSLLDLITTNATYDGLEMRFKVTKMSIQNR